MMHFRRVPKPASLFSKIFIGLCLVTLTGLVLAVVIFTPSMEPLDEVTQCPKRRAVGHMVLILIDQSDAFEEADRERTREMIARVLGSLDYADKLVAIEPNVVRTYQPRLLFSRCSPKNPASVNPLIDRVHAAEVETKVFENAFWTSVEAALAQTDAPRSPLLETFSYISQRPDFIGAERRSIHVYSDLIQYSDVADFYRTAPTVEEADGRLRAVPADFRGAQVFLAQVARRDIWESRPKVAEFWDAWLRAHGGTPQWDPTSVY